MNLVTDSLGCFFAQIPANQTYQVTAGVDTLTITTPQAGDTLQLAGQLESPLNVIGYGHAYYDNNTILTLKILTVSTDSTLEATLTYSMDGINYQPSNVFTGFAFPIPDSVYVRSGACIKKVRAYLTRGEQVCVTLSENDLNAQPVYNSLASALQAQANGNTVYKIDIYNNLNAANAFLENPTACPCLQALDLSENNITTLSPELGNLPQLQRLWLNNNQLTTVPSELGNLNLLLWLKLSDNPLTNIPSELGNLNSLLSLWLTNCQLTSLPSEIGNLNSLVSLQLANNQLSALPTEICNVKDTIGSGPYNCAAYFGNCIDLAGNPGTTTMQAQWNACP